MTLIVCQLLLVVLPANHANAAEAEAVSGLWAYRRTVPVGFAGELRVTRRGESWQGSISSATAEATAGDRVVRIAFPGEGGRFRGYFDDDIVT